MGVATSSYSTMFFIPTILNEMGYKPAQAQLHTIPIYVVCIVVAGITAYLSDRMRHRYIFTMAGILVATIGYTMLLRQELFSTSVKYLAVFFISSGVYITQPITIVWLANNMGGHYKRSFGAAIQIAVGNFGGIIGSNIYLQREMPAYRTGYGTALAMLWVAGALCTCFYFGLKRENKKRARGERNERLNAPVEVVENLGDDHPEFRFSL